MHKKVEFEVVYKPLTVSLDDFSNGLEYLMPKVKMSGNEFVCMGDFNYNLLNASGDSLEFLNLMFTNDLYAVVTLPTRVTEKSATLIDNIFVSSERINSTYADVILTPVSDYFPVLTKFQQNAPPRKRKDRAFIRELKSENTQRFGEEISVVSWGTVFEQTDPSIAFEKFNNIVADIYNSTCPMNTI